MAEQQTCGKGLAQHAVLPERIAELIAALAENLEVHMEALDLSDEEARIEHEAYSRLAAQRRQIAAQLEAVGQEMADQEELSMGRHDKAVMTSQRALDSLERFVGAQTELLHVLEQGVAREREMLSQMREASRGDGP
ncbi:MAG TPA: hypothetical protein VE270_05335 [Thermoleophilaceae bacterium]|nr:hypothetical protein [Thermoleophilaceae bacterium]